MPKTRFRDERNRSL